MHIKIMLIYRHLDPLSVIVIISSDCTHCHTEMFISDALDTSTKSVSCDNSHLMNSGQSRATR